MPKVCHKQFNEDEVYSIHLTVTEIQRYEKGMLLLNNFPIVANATDIIQHARQTRDATCKHVMYHYA